VGQYQLIQLSKSKTEQPPQYQLMYDDQIIVNSCTCLEGIKHVQKLIKLKDTYQEKEIGTPLTPKQSYDSFIEERRLDRLFDEGVLR